MKRLWPFLVGGIGLLGLVIAPLAVASAAPSTAHSDQVITVSKTAAGTGAPLAGAVFTLYKWAGKCDTTALATATSGSNGQATFPPEGHGNYCVAETTSPTGYTLPSPNSQVVKISSCKNGKASDDPANEKLCSAAAAFVDTPIQGSTPQTPPTAAGGGTATTGPTSPSVAAAGSSVPTATTVHTGLPWAGSTPYVLGVAALGAAMVGTGLFWRRRRVLSS